MDDRVTVIVRRDLLIRVVAATVSLGVGFLGSGCGSGTGGPEGAGKLPVPEGVKNMQAYITEQVAKQKGPRAKQKARAPAK